MSQVFTHGYALLVGVGECAYPKWSLPVTVKDAQALKSILTDPNFCAYPSDKQHMRLLHDKTATRSNILDELEWLKVQTASDSEATVIVYYSGHGWLDKATGKYYLIQHDVEPFDIPNSSLSAEEFTDVLRQIKAQRLLVIIDCCHAEGMATAKDGNSAIKLPAGLTQTALPKNLVDNLKQGEGRAVFTSSRGQQLSWIRSDGAMSIYTYHLIEALQGANNQAGDTAVLVSNLINHLGKSVPESAQTMHQVEQKPFFDTATEDFAIALLRGGKGLSAADKSNIQDQESENQSQVVNATGERSTAAGRDISNSPITSGNGNTVQIGGANSSNISIGKARDVNWNKNT